MLSEMVFHFASTCAAPGDWAARGEIICEAAEAGEVQHLPRVLFANLSLFFSLKVVICIFFGAFRSFFVASGFLSAC